MAPVKPASHRTPRPSKSILKTPSTESHHARPSRTESLFTTNKKDKRRIKHAGLMYKVAKAQSSKPRRRRPNKKLVTTLDSMADALPDDETTTNNTPAGAEPADQVHILKRKSIKSRPGVLKRKQKLDNEERARFTKNMAQLATAIPLADNTTNSNRPATAPTFAAQSSQKWAALRGFIAQTLEKRPDAVSRGT